jgi:hypothetical protein
MSWAVNLAFGFFCSHREPRLLPLLPALALTARQHRTGEPLLTLIPGYVQSLGRHALAGVLRSLGWEALDWSAAYRLFSYGRMNLGVAGRRLLATNLATLGPSDPLVVMDGTQLPRTSPWFPGVGWLRGPRIPVWKPVIHRDQRWAGLSVLSPRSDAGESRAVPLWFAPAPSPTRATWRRPHSALTPPAGPGCVQRGGGCGSRA